MPARIEPCVARPVKRDLLEHRNDGYALDVALLETLVAAKLEEVAAQVKAEAGSGLRS